MGSPFPRDLLSTTWDDFSSAFSSWKERDAKVLLNGLLKTFAELDLIWQKVKDDTNEVVADDYKEGIREAQLKLLVRIRKLAGDKTRGLVKRAVNEARRTRLPKKEDHKPRGVDVQNPPRSEEVSSVTSNTASAASVQPAPVVDEPTVLGMTNRQIVHELALDKDFRLKPAKKSALEQMVEKEAKRAFFTMMSEGIQNGDDLNWIPSMAQIIKEVSLMFKFSRRIQLANFYQLETLAIV